MGLRNLLLGTILGTAVVGSAHAALVTAGTPLTINETNAVTNGSDHITFQPGNTQSINNGAVHLLIQTIPAANNQEWLVYSYTSVGPSIAGNVNALWELQIQGLATTQPVSVNHFFLGWGAGGQLSNPISDNGNNLPIETNPITGVGQVFGEPVTGVIESFLDGTGQANTFAALITGDYGINPAITNFFEIAELIGPAPVPEPAGLLILGTSVMGLIWARRPRR